MNLFTDRRLIRDLQAENAALKAEIARMKAGKSAGRDRRSQAQRILVEATRMELEQSTLRQMEEF